MAASENTSADGAPGLPGDALGRAVRTPHRRPLPDTLEGIDDAKTGGSGFVGCHEDVTWMQGAVPDARFAREVDGRSELRDEWQRFVDRRRRVMAHGHVERLGGDVLLGAVCHGAFDTRGDGLDDGGVEETCVGGAAELFSKGGSLFRGDVEPENFDGDESIAIGFVGSKDGTKSADTDLMQHSERAKCWRRSKPGCVVSGQLPSSDSFRPPSAVERDLVPAFGGQG